MTANGPKTHRPRCQKVRGTDAGRPVKLHPSGSNSHALRHYAATSLLRRTGDLELVRRVLRYESLAMTLRYAVLTQTEVAAKFLHASPLDHLSVPAQKRRGQRVEV
jgi:site-specific recombinase XerC